MGACDFTHKAKGKTAKEAFLTAREEALWDHGHAGYTGTIAEKHGFKMVKVPDGKTADEFMVDCMNDESHFCQDKWGDAACIDLGNGEFMFFGWASS